MIFPVFFQFGTLEILFLSYYYVLLVFLSPLLNAMVPSSPAINFDHCCAEL